MNFEWDEAKAASNFAKHGVPFEFARDVFKDPFAIERTDNRRDYGEERYVLLGIISNRMIVVVYTMRGDVIRIISARGAEPWEKRLYHEQNS